MGQAEHTTDKVLFKCAKRTEKFVPILIQSLPVKGAICKFLI